jgi:DNA-directed RNA polymerase subunit RPC12/RpoP
METGAYFGYKCPNCNSKVTVGAIVGGSEPNCPSCGSRMIPDENGQASSANVYCPKCKSRWGFVTSEKCPICGSEFESVE